MRTIAALYVETKGPYSDLDGVEVWDETRDARTYQGPHPVVAHPPCQRWGKYWHGSPVKPHQFKLGDDGGCFEAALAAVRRWGGVLEHPAGSLAFKTFGLMNPPPQGGWLIADHRGGFTCCVEQGFYGHTANKPTWLYSCGTNLPNLLWGKGPQRLDPTTLERHGYEKARKMGMVAVVGGKNRTFTRNITPVLFRDELIGIARSAVAGKAPLEIL